MINYIGPDQDQDFRCAGERLTVIFAGKEVFILGMPRDNLHEIGDERRNLTLQQDAVPQNYVLLVDVSIVCLGDHLLIKQIGQVHNLLCKSLDIVHL